MSERMRFTSQNLNSLEKSKVDHDAMMIRDVIAMQIGEGKDYRDMGADLTTLHMLQDLANEREERGLLMRFGHPGASDNAMGYQVARGRDFRVVGDQLIHNAHLILNSRHSPVFAQDPLEYILNMAKDNPHDLMESVVITADLKWVLRTGEEIDYYYKDEDGRETRRKPENSVYDYPVLRPERFHNVDFVMEGNFTDSLHQQFAHAMFSDSVHDDLMNMFIIADDVRSRYNIPNKEIPGKIIHVGNAYLQRIGIGDQLMAKADAQPTDGVVPETPSTPTPSNDSVPTLDAFEALSKRVDAFGEQLDTDADTVTLTREEYNRLMAQGQQIQQLEQKLALMFQSVQGVMENHETLRDNQNQLDQKLRVLNNEQAYTTSVPQQHGMIPSQILDQNPIHFSQKPTASGAGETPYSGTPPSDDPLMNTMMSSARRKQAQSSQA